MRTSDHEIGCEDLTGPTKKELKKYSDEWILVVHGRIVRHSKDLMKILVASEKYSNDCYIEKVLEGQVCFY